MIIDKLLPLITLEDSKSAKKIGELLVSNNYTCAEVTFRTSATASIINEMSKVDGLIVGAGTVTSIDQVKVAINNGAKFIISPGINHSVIQYCVENSIPVFPGIITPSEIETCKNYGLSTLKVFPAGIFGGTKLLDALYGPYKNIKFIPTGGIDESNYLDYLKRPNVISIGGSFFIDKKMVENENWEDLNELLERLRKKYEELSI